jgi:hypothetical protein
MITASEFITRWQFSPLVLATEEELQDTTLTEKDRRILMSVGIPSAPFSIHNQFKVEFGGLPLKRIEAEGYTPTSWCNLYTSYKNTNFIFINKGKVMGLNLYGRYLYWINSTLTLFLESLLNYREIVTSLYSNPDLVERMRFYDPDSGIPSERNTLNAEGLDLYLELIKKSMYKIDPEILLDEDSYWYHEIYSSFGPGE